MVYVDSGSRDLLKVVCVECLHNSQGTMNIGFKFSEHCVSYDELLVHYPENKTTSTASSYDKITHSVAARYNS